jgi:hypothetical protein
MTELRLYTSFCVNADAPPSTRAAEAASFEEAAVIFAEDWHGQGAALRIVVADAESGEERCFTVDLTTGEAAPC